jgi:myosin heavy subunit
MELGNYKTLRDLLKIKNLNIDTILELLKDRYFSGYIYTSIGWPILISINPNKK